MRSLQPKDFRASAMVFRPHLSSTETACRWLSQFAEGDRPTASGLLDDFLLLNDEQVATAIRSLLFTLAQERKGRRKRIALYAERPFAEGHVSDVALVADASGPHASTSDRVKRPRRS